LVKDVQTKQVVGSLYIFNSIIDTDGNRLVFDFLFKDPTKELRFSNFGFFGIINGKVVPTVSSIARMTYNKSAFPSNTNFDLLNTNLNAKTRLVFIPVGLPQKSGRKEKITSYEDLLAAYDIPDKGSSKK
jgi:hypothetical protein